MFGAIGAIGLGLSGLSLFDKLTGGWLTKAFGGKTDEQQRQERRKQYLESISLSKFKTLAEQNKVFAEGVKTLKQTSVAMAEGSRQAAAARSKAMGRSADVESMILPGQEKAMEAGAGAVKGYQQYASKELADTARYYDALALQAEGDFANRPFDPGFMDYAGELGSTLTQYDQTQKTIDAGLNPFSGSDTMTSSGMLSATTPQMPTVGLLSAPITPSALVGPSKPFGSETMTNGTVPLQPYGKRWNPYSWTSSYPEYAMSKRLKGLGR